MMGLNKYRIVDRATDKVTAVGFGTRAAARQAKRELEYQAQVATNSEHRPSAYAVYTDVDHRDGGGIYLH